MRQFFFACLAILCSMMLGQLVVLSVLAGHFYTLPDEPHDNCKDLSCNLDLLNSNQPSNSHKDVGKQETEENGSESV